MNLIHFISNTLILSEIKAFIHVFLVPISLLVLTMNLAYSFIWIVFVVVLYLTVKRNSENAKDFFNFLFFGVGLCLYLFILTVGI